MDTYSVFRMSGHYVLLSTLTLFRLIIDLSAFYVPQSSYKVTVPYSAIPPEPLVWINKHRQQGDDSPAAKCSVLATWQDGVLLQNDTPIGLVSDTMRLILLRELVNQADSTVFDMTVGCQNMNEHASNISIQIIFMETDKWIENFCPNMPFQNSTFTNIDAVCFTENMTSFTVEENRVGTLGRIGQHPLIKLCPDSPEPRYELIQAGESFRFTDGLLDLIVPYDAEVQKEPVHLEVNCDIHSFRHNITRRVTVHVRDINDCGPLIRTPNGNVMATSRTLDVGRTNRLTFSDCDANPDVNNYHIHIENDPEDIMLVGVPAFLGKSVYVFTLEALRIPDRDLNASVIITDQSFKPPNPAASRVTYHVFVKGVKTAATKSDTDFITDPVSEALHPIVGHINTPFTPQINIYTVNISAAAANYTRVFEVLLVKPGFHLFKIIQSSQEDIPLAISAYNGVIYTTGPVAKYANTSLSVRVRGEQNFGLPLKDEIFIHVDVIPSILTQVACESSCSFALNESTCVELCGLGAPSGRCVWRAADWNLSYNTCVPSSDTCPNLVCDEDMEVDIKELCPQDCAETVSYDGEAIQGGKISATTRGTCFCENVHTCHCYSDTSTSINKTAVPGVEICDTTCVVTITVTVTGCLFIVILITVLCRLQTRSYKDNPKHMGSMASITAIPSDYVEDHDRPSGLMSFNEMSPQVVDRTFKPDPQWEIPRANIKLSNVIGEGEFGCVVRGQVMGLDHNKAHTVVAVKMLKDCASTSEFRDLLSEYNLLKDVSHRNVIRLLGVCSQKGPFLLVVEYCALGSLRSYLRRSRYHGSYIIQDMSSDPNCVEMKKIRSNDVVVTAKDCMSFFWQTANGMSYLSDMKLCHRDIAARNLLLTSDMIIKISDFGLSRDIYEGDSYMKKSKGRIPVKWMAPESLYDHVYTSKSDVWSYGILLWEIVTLGATPYPGIPPERLYRLLKTGYRMDRPQGCSNQLYQMMQRCWSADPKLRPAFKQISSELEDMMKEDIAYLDLTYGPDRILSDEDDPTNNDADTNETEHLESHKEGIHCKHLDDYSCDVKLVSEERTRENDLDGSCENVTALVSEETHFLSHGSAVGQGDSGNV